MAIRNPSELHRAFADAFNRQDLQGLLNLYESNAKVVMQDGTELVGLEEIRGGLSGFLAMSGKMSVETIFVVESNGTALCRGTWRLDGTGPDGKPVTIGANSLEVIREQADGTWLAVLDCPYGAD
jgi:ketosteroid isomerase-like protein